MRILVVDDEQEIRDYIANMAEWADIRCRVVATASNGEEALALARTEKPDVLLTDIRMPEMDGIELAENLRRSDPDLPIVFLSAYHEFDYAKKAIRLGAVDFITKPFVPLDLLRAVEQVRELQKLDWKHQDDFFTLFRLPDQRTEEKREWLEEHHHQQDSFLLLYAESDAHPGSEESRNRFLERSRAHALVPALQTCVFPSWTFGTESGLYVLIRCAAADAAAAREEALALARRIADTGADSDESTLSVGISRLHGSLLDLPAAMRETAQTMEYRMLLGRKSVLAFEAIQSILHEKEKDAALSIQRFADLLRTGDEEGIRELLRDAYRRMLTVGAGKREIQHYCIRLAEQAEAVMEEFGIAPDSQAIVDIRSKLLSGPILTDMMRDLEQHIRQCKEQINRTVEQSPKRLVMEAKRIIEREYSRDLSLQEVAKLLNVNYSYLSRLIKKETEKTFSELLWETRIEAAKVKLLTEDLKAYEIAYAVGFKDPAHFSLLFKKTVGVSPTAYKVQGSASRE